MTNNNVIAFPIDRIKNKNAENPSASAPANRPAGPATFDTTQYLPNGSTAKLIETGSGVFQIAHCLNEFIYKAADSKVEVYVLACLFRYTLGFRRSYCRAALSFIETWTGLCSSSVRRALEGLEARGIIRQVEAGTLQQDAALYEIPVIQAYLLFLASKTSKPPVPENPDPANDQTKQPESQEKPEPNSAQNEHSSEQIEQSSEQNRQSTPLNLSTKKLKHTNKTLNKDLNTHTQLQKTGSEYLDYYFVNLKPKTKRVREWRHFQSLKDDYSLQDIADCVRSLIENGTPGKGEPCHSPMAFLSCSMDIVLARVMAEREKITRKEEREHAEEDRKAKEAQKEAEEEAAFGRAVKAFKEAFPTKALQDAELDRFHSSFPFYSRNSFGLRSAAISAWYAAQNKNSN